MESRLLYSATHSLKNRIEWKKDEKYEWILFRTGNNIDIDLVNEKINKHFGVNEIYLVFERTNSGELNQEKTRELFKSLLGFSDFSLWNKELNKVMEFNKIGILRYGTISQNIKNGI